VFLWIGDLPAAEEHTAWLMAHAQSHSLTPYFEVGRGYQGAVAIQRGDAKAGIESVQLCLTRLRANRYGLRDAEFTLPLVEGLLATGQLDAAMTSIDETVRRLETTGERLYLPEVLRLKGRVLRALPRPNDDDAEVWFRRSLELSRDQGARGWELRAATDLAASLADRGEDENARAILRPVFGQFTEGLDTADLVAAKRLLADLDR
jgi:predicted ATPase